MKSAFEHSVCTCVQNSQNLATAQQGAFRPCGSSHLTLKTWIVSTLMSQRVTRESDGLQPLLSLGTSRWSLSVYNQENVKNKRLDSVFTVEPRPALAHNKWSASRIRQDRNKLETRHFWSEFANSGKSFTGGTNLAIKWYESARQEMVPTRL